MVSFIASFRSLTRKEKEKMWKKFFKTKKRNVKSLFLPPRGVSHHSKKFNILTERMNMNEGLEKKCFEVPSSDGPMLIVEGVRSSSSSSCRLSTVPISTCVVLHPLNLPSACPYLFSNHFCWSLFPLSVSFELLLLLPTLSQLVVMPLIRHAPLFITSSSLFPLPFLSTNVYGKKKCDKKEQYVGRKA